MPKQERKAATVNKPISFRLSVITRQQLDELMARWNENKAQAVSRSIAIVWEQEIGKAGRHDDSTPAKR